MLPPPAFPLGRRCGFVPSPAGRWGSTAVRPYFQTLPRVFRAVQGALSGVSWPNCLAAMIFPANSPVSGSPRHVLCPLELGAGAGCFLVPGVGSMQRCCCRLPVLIGWASCRLTKEPAVNKARAGFGKVAGLWCAGMRQLWHPGAELCMGWGWEGDGAASWPHGCSSSRVHALKPSKRFATAERRLAGAVILIPCTYTSLAQARCVWQGGGR